MRLAWLFLALFLTGPVLAEPPVDDAPKNKQKAAKPAESTPTNRLALLFVPRESAATTMTLS